MSALTDQLAGEIAAVKADAVALVSKIGTLPADSQAIIEAEVEALTASTDILSA